MSKLVNKEQFDQAVLKNGRISVVEFKKQWNGASQIFEPVFQSLTNTYEGMVDFFAVDLDKSSDLQRQFGIVEIPTILIFKRGQIVDFVAGLSPKNVLIGKIENALLIT